MARFHPAPIIAAAGLCWPQPAAADAAMYQRLVRCAAYDMMAVAVLEVEKDHKDKKAIKRHEHSARLGLELASDLLDPYHVPPAQVAADSRAFYLEQVARMKEGTPFGQIVAEAQSQCFDYTFP